MKKIITLALIVVLTGIIACQSEQTKKQYFEESSEIELVKKAVQAAEDGDANTYRSCYSDTARLWHNENWITEPGKTLDEQVKFFKNAWSTMQYYTYEDELWEMIIQNEGRVWVHFWANLHTRYIGDSLEINVPVHFAFSVIDNKIVYELGIFNEFPFYLAEQRMKEIQTE
jgi:hypothetical protein